MLSWNESQMKLPDKQKQKNVEVEVIDPVTQTGDV